MAGLRVLFSYAVSVDSGDFYCARTVPGAGHAAAQGIDDRDRVEPFAGAFSHWIRRSASVSGKGEWRLRVALRRSCRAEDRHKETVMTFL
jgi:hypothetical protein